ncbi:hypothetical protein ACP70R_011445 [Stipagrostis hirtigluma subsp. patula]
MSMDTLQVPELFGCVLVALAAVLLFRQLPPFKRRAASPSLPRPRGLPLVGNLHQLGALPHASLAAMAARHAAPLMLLRLGSVPALVVSSAGAARAVFQRNDRALSGRPALRAAARLSYGLRDISFAPPEEPWRAARRACVTELLGAPRVRVFRGVREAEAAALVAAVADASRAGSPVNLSDMLVAASNRIVRRIAFGDDGEETIETKAVLLEAQKLFAAFFVADYMPWLGWLDTLRGMRSRLERNFHELDTVFERVINDHLKKHALSKEEEEEEEEDLVDVLLRLHGDPAHRDTFSSRSRIKAILMDMFIAGTDTSAAALEWTMTELLRHPDVLAKAQHEVRSVVAGKAIVLESDLPRLHYLKLVIRESLRLHPPAPLLVPRETTEPITVHGCEIPAGTQVLVNAKAIGADPDAWGPDAARFSPERHDGDGVDLGDHRPWHGSFRLVPFGLGRRSCPGVHFSTVVVELLLANLLLCFDWRAPDGEEVVDVEEQSGLTVYRKNPLVLAAERRCPQ